MVRGWFTARSNETSVALTGKCLASWEPRPAAGLFLIIPLIRLEQKLGTAVGRIEHSGLCPKDFGMHC